MWRECLKAAHKQGNDVQRALVTTASWLHRFFCGGKHNCKLLALLNYLVAASHEKLSHYWPCRFFFDTWPDLIEFLFHAGYMYALAKQNFPLASACTCTCSYEHILKFNAVMVSEMKKCCWRFSYCTMLYACSEKGCSSIVAERSAALFHLLDCYTFGSIIHS